MPAKMRSSFQGLELVMDGKESMTHIRKVYVSYPPPLHWLVFIDNRSCYFRSLSSIMFGYVKYVPHPYHHFCVEAGEKIFKFIMTPA